MKIINIGILAHVDAGKTTLTESLLYTSGAIMEPGNVDKGTTRTDSMALERQRGITIQAAVTSFHWKEYKVNLVDTPDTTCQGQIQKSLYECADQKSYRKMSCNLCQYHGMHRFFQHLPDSYIKPSKDACPIGRHRQECLPHNFHLSAPLIF